MRMMKKNKIMMRMMKMKIIFSFISSSGGARGEHLGEVLPPFGGRGGKK
jgi:hypothetical protein